MKIKAIVNYLNPMMILREFSTNPLLSNYLTRLYLLLKKGKTN